MNALVLGGIGLGALALGYLFYSKKVVQWAGLDQGMTPPAVEMRDGVDYVPARHWSMLFGHHFASIAGAAPIIGPVVACLVWGWLPAVLWIVLGGIFFGAVHDYMALATSLENKGRSVSDLSESVLGRSAKIVFGCFVFLALILIVAVFAAVAGQTLATTPAVVIPTFGLIFVALIVGVLVYHTPLPIAVSTVIGLALLAGLVVAGYHLPLRLPWPTVDRQAVAGAIGQLEDVPQEGFEAQMASAAALLQEGKPDLATGRLDGMDEEKLNPRQQERLAELRALAKNTLGKVAKSWTVILLIYAMVAAVLPVTVLLQPRDHLAAAVLFIGMVLGFTGVVLSRPTLQSPHFVAFQGGQQGWLWPMLFVVIACSAISGFHSLVASGTTSKQLPAVQSARQIGYGGMIMESALGLLAVLAVTAGLYWQRVPAGQEGFVYQKLMARTGWIGTFGRGYGKLIESMFPTIGFLIGITMLKTFVMTTLDSATRITRYICSELFADTFGIKPLKNRYVATVFIGVCAGALALGNWRAIWPIFGSANQLIAAMALIIATVYLMSRARSWVFTAVPAVLVFITAMGALVYKLIDFLTPEEGAEPKRLLAAVAVALIILGLFVAYRGVLAVAAAARRKSQTAGGEAPQPSEGA